MRLLAVEMRRALHRRVVHVLVLLALVGCVVGGVAAFVDSSGKTIAELHFEGQRHAAVMRDWWVAGSADGMLAFPAFLLLIGGLFGGASVAGAEWRAGTVASFLTWEPRRTRVHLCRLAACGLLAALIAFVLQALFLASFLPAVIFHGSSAGVDAAWWASLVLAMARVSLFTATAAALGAAFATLGRNTAFALVVVFAWFAVIEGLIRSLKPGLTGYLWGPNVATALPWAAINDEHLRHGPGLALGRVLAYATAVVVASALAFRRRDLPTAA
jgi:ABC-2 type transport system permease protein